MTSRPCSVTRRSLSSFVSHYKDNRTNTTHNTSKLLSVRPVIVPEKVIVIAIVCVFKSVIDFNRLKSKACMLRLRYDLKAKNRRFSILPSDIPPSLGVNPFEFLDEPLSLDLDSVEMPAASRIFEHGELDKCCLVTVAMTGEPEVARLASKTAILPFLVIVIVAVA